MIERCKSESSFTAKKEYNAVVCGVNIKPISKKDKKIKTFLDIVQECEKTKWRVFVHCRLDNGDQYDAIFELENSYVIKQGGVCPFTKRVKKNIKKLSIRNNKYTTAIIPVILRIFGVNEWVELIGTKVTLIEENEGMSIGISGYYERDHDMRILPEYYEYHSSNE